MKRPKSARSKKAKSTPPPADRVRPYSKWSAEKVKSEIRKRFGLGEDISVKSIKGTPLYMAAYRYLGSYRKAVDAAGIPYESVWRRPRPKRDKAAVIAELQALHRSGVKLAPTTVSNTNSPLFVSARHRFGSYRAALEAGGIDYESIRARRARYPNREAIIKELQKLCREKLPLKDRSLRKLRPGLTSAIVRHFGTAREACQAAGIDYEAAGGGEWRRWDASRVIHELQRRQQSGKGLWRGAVARDTSHLMPMATRYFGGYAQALRAAGIPLSAMTPPRSHREPPLTRAQIVERLQALHARGESMHCRALRKSDRHLYNSILARFNLRQALHAAGIVWTRKSRESRKMRHWTAPIVIEALQQLHSEGVDLRISKMRKSHNPLFTATIHYFGAYGNAIVEAGVNYEEMVRAQLAREAGVRRAGEPQNA